MKLAKTLGGALVAAALIGPLQAQAAHFSGEFWKVAPDSISSIDQAIAAVAGGSIAPTARFDSTVIQYGNASADWAVGSLTDFLNADAGSIIGSALPYIQESVFRISGTAFLENGKDVWVTSDDGFRLIVDGSTFSEDTGLRGPYSTTSTAWTGATGIYDVTLWYFEGHEWQGRLESNLVAAVPAPATLVLMITALGGLGLGLRRRRKVLA